MGMGALQPEEKSGSPPPWGRGAGCYPAGSPRGRPWRPVGVFFRRGVCPPKKTGRGVMGERTKGGPHPPKKDKKRAGGKNKWGMR